MILARFPPLSQARLVHVSRRPLRLQTTAGEVALRVAYGWDPESEQWVCPARQAWGLEPNAKMSPELEDRLCFTATQAGSYEGAAQVARKWGCRAADDSTIHALVQKRGQKALEAEVVRVKRVEWPSERPRVGREAKGDLPAGPFDLVIMMDGWMNRQRGEDWGLKPPETQAQRVDWHEIKTAVIFRLDHRGHTASGRGMLVEKFTVTYQGEPWEFGRRVYAEAVRRGLDQARRVYFVADGGEWIWKLKSERFQGAIGLLDFYHAAQHLWSLATARFGDQTIEGRQWAEPLLHQLHNGKERNVLRTLQALMEDLGPEVGAQTREAIEREVRYFQSHRKHLAYKKQRDEGCPNGSGAMESVCAQLQRRFKGTGQFWTQTGKDRLMAMEMARRNRDWDVLWDVAA